MFGRFLNTSQLYQQDRLWNRIDCEKIFLSEEDVEILQDYIRLKVKEWLLQLVIDQIDLSTVELVMFLPIFVLNLKKNYQRCFWDFFNIMNNSISKKKLHMLQNLSF